MLGAHSYRTVLLLSTVKQAVLCRLGCLADNGILDSRDCQNPAQFVQLSIRTSHRIGEIQEGFPESSATAGRCVDIAFPALWAMHRCCCSSRQVRKSISGDIPLCCPAYFRSLIKYCTPPKLRNCCQALRTI